MNKMNQMQPASWLGIGVALGVAVGAVFDNIALGIVFGLLLGTGMMVYQTSQQEKDGNQDSVDQ